jgi:hypothetical protein
MMLTRGETWWLARHRFALGQQAFAATLGVRPDRVRDWERDRGAPSPVPPEPNKKLTAGEWCIIQRRRHGWTLQTAANEMRMTRMTLWKGEHDKTRGVARAVRFYRARGVQQAASTAVPGADVAEGSRLAAIIAQTGAEVTAA